jgi:hypothetical protein
LADAGKAAAAATAVVFARNLRRFDFIGGLHSFFTTETYRFRLVATTFLIASTVVFVRKSPIRFARSRLLARFEIMFRAMMGSS